ncbi:AAA family ATPase [Laribacter hongkongensis]|uniref:AAA family ATPase n=1 Tax=Laribacter hongkongensis TaxID=168471 RepID=UPI001EFDCA41|nr:AAA family ATPase [Laribacter hongkongensis]MCG9042135.1 AAA family ATPase [Laribacter hongkongensis]MCG9066940.1 AAA family ATPase [Laribacter hongkongensis]
MILEFRISNFRSIRDEQVLSLIANSSDKALAETHLAPTGLKALPQTVRTAVIYGPNASGKSTLLDALNYLRTVVAESATVIQPGQSYTLQPFKFDAEHAHAPTQFELTFMLEGVRHQYSFAMTAERIINESLLVYRTAKPQQWFVRTQNESGDGYHYEFSSHLTGSRKLWQDSTRPNALFLSTAAQLNSELLGPVFRAIVDTILFLPAGAQFSHDSTTALLESEEGRASIRDFLMAADIGIADIQTTSRKGTRQLMVMHEGALRIASSEERETQVPLFLHQTAHGSARLELHEESEGTQRLYGLIAPVLDVLKHGRTLVVDELDGSLHTLLVRYLIQMFHNPALNPRGAQLIFSTHDTSLLDHSLFRRDQIWFTEKDEGQSSQLYPLTDFSPRKHEAWERGYLTGRYGAIPFFSQLPAALQTPAKADAHAAG